MASTRKSLDPEARESQKATGKWLDRGVPHKGWSYISVEDLGEPDAVCEMCEVREIRYVHYMSHPKYPEVLGVGCVCAEHMGEDYKTPKLRERALRNASGRRRRWLTRLWRVSRSGNEYLNTGNYNVVIYEKQDRYGYRIADRQTDEALFSPRLFRTSDRAKLAAFDQLVLLQSNQNRE